ncbi:MAG: winged helix-turn-helix domain-containing protein [Oscillochloridaceae bacterium umkhey_bin13]
MASEGRFDNQVHWAKFYLSRAGYIDSTTRGVWSLTEKGQASTISTFDQAIIIFKPIQDQFREEKEDNQQTRKDKKRSDRRKTVCICYTIGSKGIILTTGTFTSEARREALRDGVPPIELVDGEKLIDMFRDLQLGLKPRTIYDIDEVQLTAIRWNTTPVGALSAWGHFCFADAEEIGPRMIARLAKHTALRPHTTCRW